jgi:ABC transporter transmembrane region
MKAKDARMGVVGEIFQGIRIIKLFAWEREFMGRISEARRVEMNSLRSYMVTMAFVIVQVGADIQHAYTYE